MRLSLRRSKFLLITTGIAIGGLSLAQAQSGSPFASKKKTQAWEIPSTTAPATTAPDTDTSGVYIPPSPSATSTASVPPVRSYSSEALTAPPTSRPPPAPIKALPDSTEASTLPGSSGSYYSSAPSTGRAGAGFTHSLGATYGGTPRYSQSQAQARSYQQPPTQTNQARTYQAQPYQGGPYGSPQGQVREAPRSWAERLGWGNIAKTVSGFLKVGAAATDKETRGSDGWDADFIVDGRLRGELSAITESGLEYGLGAEVRAQYDADRRGFGGRVGDCPPTQAGCASVDIDGTATAIRGHTTQFYTAGPSNAKDTEIALEGAYVFLRSAYGDFTVGRDDGAAYLFSLGAPTLVAISVSNSPVDYTGLDSVKTVNDASGFAEKITYTSPRLLGDQIGFGVQVGASYAPNARACGVDYCVRRNGADGSGALSPDLEDVIELGLSLDRTFDNGLSAEATVTYSTASEASTIAAFDDLKALGLGLKLGWNDFELGASYLDSNNGLADGDYTAYDVGLTWKPSEWGVTMGYGYAKDDNIDLTSNQGLLALSYDVGKFRLGTGVQYIERRIPVVTGGIIERDKEKAAALFIEGAVTF